MHSTEAVLEMQAALAALTPSMLDEVLMEYQPQDRLEVEQILDQASRAIEMTMAIPSAMLELVANDQPTGQADEQHITAAAGPSSSSAPHGPQV